jgi:hypothetical protein
MSYRLKRLRALALLPILGLAACASYPELAYTKAGSSLILTGVIDAETAPSLSAALRTNPEVNRLILDSIPGSADDEASLSKLAKLVRNSGVTTHVPSHGMVASGGTDMVVMGKTRRIDTGACIGVHTWAAGWSETGADLARDDPKHDLYLDFYRDMGIDPAFYWFTLDAAGPDNVHWMSAAEINRFGLSSTLVKDPKDETFSQRKKRCDARVQ